MWATTDKELELVDQTHLLSQFCLQMDIRYQSTAANHLFLSMAGEQLLYCLGLLLLVWKELVAECLVHHILDPNHLHNRKSRILVHNRNNNPTLHRSHRR